MARTRLLRRLRLIALVLFVACALYPPSHRLTRAGALVLFVVVWVGLSIHGWQRRALRFALLGVPLLSAGFLALPGRSLPAADSLRGDYVAGLRRFDGVTYLWGGENPIGIDCSGLGRVVSVSTPTDNLWFRGPMNIVRWKLFEP